MNATGHMLVTRIAWDEMTPSTRQAVELLTADPNNPITGKPTTELDNDVFTASTWMDDIKPSLRTRHYIDIPLNGNGAFPEGPNSLTYIKDRIRILKDPKASKDEKAEALRVTMHLVGDIHQPLHDCDNDDHGGNSFALNGQNELHQLWDSGGNQWKRIERPLQEKGREKLAELAAGIEKAYPLAEYRFRASDLNPDDWAREGYAIDKKDVYDGVHRYHAASESYLEKARQDMNLQAALGGYRLANLLNGIFEKSPVVPASVSAAAAMPAPLPASDKGPIAII